MYLWRKCLNDAKDAPKAPPTGPEVTSCILNNSYFTVAYVIMGTYAGVKTKSYRPLMAAALLGSLSDGAYGYFYSCSDLIKAYDKSKNSM